MKFLVITHTKKIKLSNDDILSKDYSYGSCYNPPTVKYRDKLFINCEFGEGEIEKTTPLLSCCMLVYAPVFEEGEILIVDDTEREITGRRRKPSKWDVEYESFDTLEDAIQKAIFVGKNIN